MVVTGCSWIRGSVSLPAEWNHCLGAPAVSQALSLQVRADVHGEVAAKLLVVLTTHRKGPFAGGYCDGSHAASQPCQLHGAVHHPSLHTDW